MCAPLRRVTCRCTGTCCSSRAKVRRAALTAASRACPSRSARIACAAFASSTSPTCQTAEVRHQRADLPRIAHPHGRDRSAATRPTSTSMCPARPGSAPPTNCPAAPTAPIEDPNTARFRLEVIKVPLAAPEKAAIVSSPRIFEGLAPPPRRVEPGRGGNAAAGAAGAPGAAGAGAAGADRCRRVRLERRGRGGSGWRPWWRPERAQHRAQSVP